MQNIYKILSAIIFLIVTSCELTVDVDLPEFKPSLVVNCVISPEDTAVVLNLSQNRSILDNSYDFILVNNATVKFYEGETFIGNLLPANDPGSYSLDFNPQRGKEYSINIDKTGFEPVSSSTQIPSDTAQISLSAISHKPDEYGGQSTRITYMIRDPKGPDFYETSLYILYGYDNWYYDEVLDSVIHEKHKPTWQKIHYSNVGADVNEFEDNSYQQQFSDELFDGQNHESIIEFSSFRQPDETGADTLRFKLVVHKLTSDYYRYLNTSQLQSDLGGSPFAQPIQVYSNIKNGLGILGSHNSSTLPFTLINGEWQK